MTLYSNDNMVNFVELMEKYNAKGNKFAVSINFSFDRKSKLKSKLLGRFFVPDQVNELIDTLKKYY